MQNRCDAHWMARRFQRPGLAGWVALAVAAGWMSLAANPGRAQSPPKPQPVERVAAAPVAPPAQAVAPTGAQPASGMNQHDPNRQIEAQSAELFQMAASLKAAVDKTTKDMLSVAVMRQAGAIEQLARTMRDEMKPMVKKN